MIVSRDDKGNFTALLCRECANNLRPLYRVIVAGGRKFNDYALLRGELNRLLANKFITHDIAIVSGKAKGADTLGERYAKEYEFPIHEYPANWDLHGNGAGPIRNRLMSVNADACVVFWDGESRGSLNMRDTALARGLPTRVIRY
jgi:predicted Rossmann fold nucleotide-binding protein DprA/Smf involved in DNA uptake